MPDTERLRAILDSGKEVFVTKITSSLPGYPHIMATPSYCLLDGERLNPHPDDTDSTLFISLLTHRRVRILP